MIHSNMIAKINAKLFNILSKIPNTVLPAPVVNMAVTQKPITQIMVTAFLRERPNSVISEDVTDSTRAIAEVRPAINIQKKNTGPIIYAASPITLNT